MEQGSKEAFILKIRIAITEIKREERRVKFGKEKYEHRVNRWLFKIGSRYRESSIYVNHLYTSRVNCHAQIEITRVEDQKNHFLAV